MFSHDSRREKKTVDIKLHDDYFPSIHFMKTHFLIDLYSVKSLIYNSLSVQKDYKDTKYIQYMTSAE